MAKTNWVLDPTHSEIQFKVKHMLISNVSGNFSKFDASIVSEREDFEGAQINFSAEIDSISTGQQQRDGHLKSEDFFHSSQFPKLTFISTSFKKVDQEVYVLQGNLSLRDQTHPIELAVEYGGTILDPYGNSRAGFSLTGKISRKDFGLTWNALLESGGAVVADEVKIFANMEFIQAK
ncbi:MAG: YceI family protein [Chitinophagaceae bacterium]